MSIVSIPSGLYDRDDSGDSEGSVARNTEVMSTRNLINASQNKNAVVTQARRAKRMLVPDIDMEEIWGDRYHFAPVMKLMPLFDNQDGILKRVVSETDWPDSKMMDRPGIRLMKLTLNSRIKIGKRIIEDIHTGISDRTIGSIFLSAWNICRDFRGTRVYPRVDPTRTNDDILYNRLSNNQEPQTVYPLTVDYRGSDEKIAEGLSFFCGSLLRLFTKSAENYVSAWDTIKKTFLTLYETSFPILDFTPNIEMITTIKTMLTSTDTYRNTLTGFLYTEHEVDSNASGIRNFLHEIHLAFTGMHSLTLFLQIVDKLKIAPLDLISAVYHSRTEDAADEIAAVLALYSSKEPKVGYDQRETWRFARIFSSRFFAHIHSRKCPELIVIFGAMLSKLEDQDNRNNNVFRIAQTENMAPDTFEKYREIGIRLYAHFMAEPGKHMNPISEPDMGNRRNRNQRRRIEESEEEDDDEGVIPEVVSDFGEE